MPPPTHRIEATVAHSPGSIVEAGISIMKGVAMFPNFIHDSSLLLLLLAKCTGGLYKRCVMELFDGLSVDIAIPNMHVYYSP